MPSSAAVEVAVSLLDKGTELGRVARLSGRWCGSVYPTAGEGTVAWKALSRGGGPLSEAERASVASLGRSVVETDNERAVRRARGAVRRYLAHNGLTEMVTLTFAGVPPHVADLSGCVKAFRRRVLRSSGVDLAPYVWVPEWGKETGRLHVHLATRAFSAGAFVEVCEVCAVERLRLVRSDLPPAGSRCFGCLWGWGFVGRPERARRDGSGGLSSYLSKYLAKDLGGYLPAGSQRYRVAQGFAVPRLRVEADSLVGAVACVVDGFWGTVVCSGEPPIIDAPFSAPSGPVVRVRSVV